MKKSIVVALVLIMLFSLTACNENIPNEAGGGVPDALSDEPAPTPTAATPATTPKSPEPEPTPTPTPSPEPFSGIKCVEEFVKLDSHHLLRGILPYFDDINDVDLATLLNFAVSNLGLERSELSIEQHKRLFEDEDYINRLPMYQIAPFSIDEQLKTFLNPNFSIETYDYKNYNMTYPEFNFQRLIWDEEVNQIVSLILTFACPGAYRNEILSVYEEDDFYYVVTGGFWYSVYEFGSSLKFSDVRDNPTEHEDRGSIWDFGYNIYTFKINENGNVNIISKQPYEAVGG
ncbi:MAG: hypothetical protein FWE60_04240 [Oscillospiraceae bacterium]|jgi:hypothetical protein|nr:hypothetical protein [Oscillospiraceae bacterium]